MKIVRMKRKVKIIFEYSTAGDVINHDAGDTKDLNIKVFLKNGRTVVCSEIDNFTINAKDDGD